MRRIGLRVLTLLIAATTASATLAQEGIHWQHDIEAAKLAAKQTNRLVLVHVWGDGCGPCRALESNVFNQPGVGGAIEQQFVPVKLNANEFPATAQGFGITRIPTDVVITPDGQMIAKMISPATPSSYVGDLNQVASKYRSTSGQAFQFAASNAPHPSTLNPAYATLPINAPQIPAIPVSAPAGSPMQTTASMPSPYLPAQPGSTTFVPPATQAAAPTNNPYGPYGAPASNPHPAAAPQSMPTNQVVGDRYAMPPGNVPAMAPAMAPAPTNAANPYVTYSAGAMQTGPATAAAMPLTPNSYAPPVAAPVTGYDMETPTAGASVPADFNLPPASGGGLPVSGDARVEHVVPPYPAAASTAAIPPATATQQLPPGAPALAFEGYCPVSMRTNWKWVQGDVKYGAIHRGRTFLFASPQEQQQFLANPDGYCPALVGIDPVLAIDHQQSVAGTREHSLDYDNQFYLFSSEATLQQFQANPERYASGVRQAMGIRPGEQTR